MAKAIRVPRKKGEEMRRKLSSSGILDEEYFPSHDEKYVYLPVKKSVPRYKLVEVEARKRELRKGFKEMLAEIVGESAEGVFSSYDIVGDIAVLEIPDNLRAKENEIADALLRTNGNIKVVLRKESGMEGEYRVRRFAFLAGEKRTETTYVEHGVRMRLDLAKVYFSPRLSHERGRIAEKVKPGETVLVMFAGVGPFALVIARKQRDAKVYGIELNPDAVKYFEENVKLNGMDGRVEAILGDVRKIIPERFAGVADRVLMPLPKSAEDFLDAALLAAKKGGIIHFYTFVNRKDGKGAAEKKVLEAGKRAGRKIQILESREVRPFSPSTVQIVVDFRADGGT